MTTHALRPERVEPDDAPPELSEPQREEIVLHGHRVSYRRAGSGPVVLLVHGVAGRAEQWAPVQSLLAEHFTVIAPDLLGHGASAKPRGDYSLGAYAAGLRDLLLALGHDRATIVGHSLGGGIAMQFAYQFPERCERLALVGSGGLGREVSIVLRAATLPGSELVLPLLCARRVTAVARGLAGALGRIGLQAAPDVAEIARSLGSLSDGEARAAFLRTIRAVVDPVGQAIDASDRLYLASEMPALIVWGARDPIIPVEHGRHAHRSMPGSELVVLDGAGHFPQLDDPVTVARTLRRFVERTDPAEIDLDAVRERLLAGAPAEGGTR